MLVGVWVGRWSSDDGGGTGKAVTNNAVETTNMRMALFILGVVGGHWIGGVWVEGG